MSLQNNSSISKVWATIEITRLIALFSDDRAIIALSLTCTQLYRTIVQNNDLWYNLCLQKYRTIAELELIWTKRQMQQIRVAPILSDNLSTKNSGLWSKLYQKSISKSSRFSKDCGQEDVAPTAIVDDELKSCTWMHLYKQRKYMLANWQSNQPAWASDIVLAKENVQLKLDLSDLFFTSSCPAQSLLIELRIREPAIAHLLDWKKDDSDMIFSSTFNNDHQAQYSAKGWNTHNEESNKHNANKHKNLQIWNTGNRQLIRTIKNDGLQTFEVFGSSALYHNAIDHTSQHPHPYGSITLITDILAPPPCELRSVIISNEVENQRYDIQTTNDKYVNLLRYNYTKTPTTYEILHAPIEAISTDIASTKSSAKTISTGHFPTPENMVNNVLNFYPVDRNRVLFKGYYRAANGSAAHLTANAPEDGLSLISISNGIVWNRSYDGYKIYNAIVMAEHHVCIFQCYANQAIVVVSLLDGRIQLEISAKDANSEFKSFERVVGSLIAGYNYQTNQYCIIDVLTGERSIFSFPIPSVRRCISVFGHMLMTNDKTTHAVSFVL
ncbi:hypothetical protein BDF19DRAFT_440525 [Syncephalis fuscata]|nr:hypothetical protein BDF19DRAFT_440525 [Syncephalis fuscata]